MKDKNWFLLRRVTTICMAVFFLCFGMPEAVAAETGKIANEAACVVSTRTTEEEVYVYIKGVDSIVGGTTVQLGNALCEDIQVAEIVSMGMPVMTTILLDNSSSLSQRWGDQAKELVKGLIDSHAENEEFRIATFADELNVVAEFSAEYESLKTAVEGIEFLNQESYLTDILYDLLKEGRDSGEANYIRLVIITDGADDNEIKYTQAELFDLMRSSGVVIHTVGVDTSKNNRLLEELFSYARLTGGTYQMADKDTNVEGIKTKIQEDHSLLCLKLIPQKEILDGSRKEAKLNLNTPNGEVVLTASLQMPFADVSSMSSEDTEADESPAPETEAEVPKLPTIVIGQQSQGSALETPETEKNSILPIMVMGAVALTLVAVLTVFIALKRKKKEVADKTALSLKGSGDSTQNAKPQNTSVQTSDAPQGSPVRLGGNTVRLGGQTSAGECEETLHLQGGVGRNGVKQCFVTLTHMDNPHKSFKVPIDVRIIIGRGAGDIVLEHDAAVSYMHCEILKKGNLFYVNDLKSSNGTFYENMRVCRETPIMDGGVLEVGTGKYKITIES